MVKSWFPLILAVLQVGASIEAFSRGDTKMGVFWLGIVGSNVGLAFL